MTPRWMIERKYATHEDVLLIIEVYAPHENKEVVKAENQHWTYKKDLIISN